MAMKDAIPLYGTPILWAVKNLGSKRVRWIGQSQKLTGEAEANTPTCWSLDGKRATHGELMLAAEKKTKKAA